MSEEQGRELADRLKVPYIETSAKDPPVNVDAAFHEIVRIVKSFPSDEDNERVSNICILKVNELIIVDVKE